MSTQKSAIELLRGFEQRLASLEEEYLSVKNVVELVRKSLNLSSDLQQVSFVAEKNATLYLLGMTTPDPCLKFLEKSKKTCSTEEVASNIYSRGINGKLEIKDKTTGAALSRLAKQGKITMIGRGFRQIKEEHISIEISNEHEQL